MNRHITLSKSAYGFLFLAICAGVVLQLNQGGMLIDHIRESQMSESNVRAVYYKAQLAKSFSAITLVSLFLYGYSFIKRHYAKGKLLNCISIIPLYAFCFGALNTLIHYYLNPYFSFSIFSDLKPQTLGFKGLYEFLFFSVLGLAAILASVPFVVKSHSKTVQGITIHNVGNRYKSINYVIYFTIILVYLILSSPSLGLQTFFNIALAIFLTGYILEIGILNLIAFANGKTISFIKPFKSILQSLLTTLGGFCFIFILASLVFGFDSSLLMTVNTLPQTLLGILIFYLLSCAISIGTWKLNLLGVRSQSQLTEAKSELSFLKSQINPHFLFNSLNSLYGIALAENSPKTSTGIQKLSEMMRFMLRENVEDQIDVSRELEYVENYIELQKLRIEGNDKVKLDYHIDQACEGKITPMLIIPFIENAFKHGVSAHHESWIDIKLECKEGSIRLNVKNSNFQKEKSNREESGIGLENVRQRLKMLYPDKHLFQIFEDEDRFEANIKIELS